MIKAKLRYYDRRYIGSERPDGVAVQMLLSAIGAQVKSTKCREHIFHGDYDTIVTVKANFLDWKDFHKFIEGVNECTTFPVEVVKVKQSLFHGTLN